MQPSLKHKLAVGGLVGGLVLGAGAVTGGAIGLGALSGDDSPTQATGVTSPSTPDSAPGTSGGGAEEQSLAFVDLADGTSQTFGAGAAGSVTVSRAGGTLTIVSADPAGGFVVSERQDVGREVEVTFAGNGAAVKFDAELEDGAVRVRVRTRGATRATLPGTLPTAPTTPTSFDDHGGSSGPGGGFDDDAGDDHGGNRGPGGGDDDSGSDDHGGNGGHGGGDD